MKKCFLAALLGMVAGCSSFDREWKEARAVQPSADLSGAWTGRWKSLPGGRGGRMRGLIEKIEDGHYRARFRVTHYWFLPLELPVVLAVTETNGSVRFCGHAQVGALAGSTIRYSGTATTDVLSAIYRSKIDRGTIEMTRAR